MRNTSKIGSGIGIGQQSKQGLSMSQTRITGIGSMTSIDGYNNDFASE